MSNGASFANATPRYAVRIIGPSGMETYLASGGQEVPIELAYPYRTHHDAFEAGAQYRRRFANQNFTYEVVNLDDHEERSFD